MVEPIELKCTYFPETRAGVTPEGEKRVKGIIHWVEASTGVQVPGESIRSSLSCRRTWKRKWRLTSMISIQTHWKFSRV